jgi:glutaredoxin-related protein
MKSELMEKHGFHTLPAIFIKGALIGGFTELETLYRTGHLEKKFF